MKMKITPYNFLLWITTFIVAFTFLLFWAFLDKGLEIPKIQGGYQSERYVHRFLGRTLNRDEQIKLWQGIQSIPHDSFAVYMHPSVMYDDVERSKNMDVTGVYIQNDMVTHPLRSGRYFSREEMCSDSQIAVIGNRYLDEVYQKDGKDYIRIREQEFEMIGTIGIDSPSTLDTMILIPFKTSMELYSGCVLNFTIDANSHDEVTKALSVIDPVLETSDDLIERSEKARRESQLSQSILAGEEKMNHITKVYLMTTLNVVIVILFSAFYWGQKKEKYIEVSYLLGFSKRSIFLSLLLEFLKIVLPALLLVFAIFALFSPLFFSYRLNLLKADNIFWVLSIILIPGVLVIAFEIISILYKKVRR